MQTDATNTNIQLFNIFVNSFLPVIVLKIYITVLIQGGPEKTAQTLMRYNFSTAGHRVTRFPAKCSETNYGNTKKNSVRLLQLTILC